MRDGGPAETPVDRDRWGITEAFEAEVPESTFIWRLLFGFEGSKTFNGPWKLNRRNESLNPRMSRIKQPHLKRKLRKRTNES